MLGNFHISFKLANFDVKFSQYTVDNYVIIIIIIIIIIRSLNNMKMNLKKMMIMIMMLMVISYVNLKLTQRLMNLIIIKHLLTILTFMKKKQLIITRINQLIMEYHWIMKLLLKENKDYLIIQIFLWEELIAMVMHNHQVRFYLIFFIFSSHFPPSAFSPSLSPLSISC